MLVAYVHWLMLHNLSTDFRLGQHLVPLLPSVFPYQRKTQLVPVLWPEHPNYAGSPSLCPSDWLSLEEHPQ